MDGKNIGEYELSSFLNLKETIIKDLEKADKEKGIDGTLYAAALLSNFSSPYLIKDNPNTEIPAMFECVDLVLKMNLPDSLKKPLEALKEKDVDELNRIVESIKTKKRCDNQNSMPSNSGCMILILFMILVTILSLV